MNRRQWKFLPVLILLLFLPVMALARQPAYSLQKLEEMALESHPSLHVSGAKIKESAAELKIARQYPNPELEGEVSRQKGLEDGAYGTGYSVGVSQAVEWPGRRARKQEAARFGLSAAQEKFAQEQLNVRARCREIYYRILAGEQLAAIARQNLESAQKLLDLAEARVRLGESRPIELIKARLEFFSAQREHDQAKIALSGNKQVLQRFLDGSLPPDFTLAGEPHRVPPLAPLQRWQEAALAAHPLLLAQEAQVSQAESQLGAARQAWMPEVKVKVFHTKEVDLQATGGGLSFPLPLWHRHGGEVAKAAAVKSQASSELRLLKQELQTNVETQYNLSETARRQVEAFQASILQEAAESLRVAQFAYEHGETSLLELLDSRRVHRATEQDYQKALLDYRLARVELWRVSGGGAK